VLNKTTNGEFEILKELNAQLFTAGVRKFDSTLRARNCLDQNSVSKFEFTITD